MTRAQRLSFESLLSDISWGQRRRLVAHLDADSNWENVISHIRERHNPERERYNYLAIQTFSRKKSPSEELLRDWQTQNPTIDELYQILLQARLHPPAEYIHNDILGLGPLQPFTGGQPNIQLQGGSSSRPTYPSSFESFQESSGEVGSYAPHGAIAAGPQPYPITRNGLQHTKSGMDEAAMTSITEKIDDYLINKSDSADRLKKYTYVDLDLFTESFDDTPLNNGGMFLGEGGFGKVYLGVEKGPEGIRLIAVKRFNIDSVHELSRGDEITNLKNVSLRHPNLVSLIGFCTDFCFCIVYEYMNGGNLSDRLEKPTTVEQTLSAQQRLSIAVDVANGLNYLHSLDPPVVHRDIKSANILLNDSLTAKIGDFGIARVQTLQGSSFTNSTKIAQGSTAYMAPEALTGTVSTKGDVYAFGVVLLEILCAIGPVYEDSEGQQCPFMGIFGEEDIKVCDLIDGKCDWSPEHVEKLLDLAQHCGKTKKGKRPDMAEVLKKLQEMLAELK